MFIFFFFASRRRHTSSDRDWSSDVCSSDLHQAATMEFGGFHADMQHFGDLLGRSPFADELQHLPFPGGEMRAVVAVIVWRSTGVHDGLGGSGADVEPPAPNLFNRTN